MLATHFQDMLEQKVKHVSAMKFVTDQESSIEKYYFWSRTVVILSWSTLCQPPALHHEPGGLQLAEQGLTFRGLGRLPWGSSLLPSLPGAPCPPSSCRSCLLSLGWCSSNAARTQPQWYTPSPLLPPSSCATPTSGGSTPWNRTRLTSIGGRRGWAATGWRRMHWWGARSPSSCYEWPPSRRIL